MTEIFPAKKRHRLTNMKYDEISLVDKGANQYAHVVIVKRDISKLREGGRNGGGPPPKRKADFFNSTTVADKKQAASYGLTSHGNKKTGSSSSSSRKRGTSQRAQNWNSARHPRQASGNPSGGEFAQTSSQSKAKYGKNGTTKAKQTSTKKKTTATTKPSSYKVKKGDTLWALAQKYYGDGTKWKLIAQANGVKDPRKLQIGVTLKIPGVSAAPAKKAAKKPAAKKTAAAKKTPVKTSGKRLVMEPGGKVHWEPIKAAVKKNLSGSEILVLEMMFEDYIGRR